MLDTVTLQWPLVSIKRRRKIRTVEESSTSELRYQYWKERW
jgi:hypothetical protein